jgi:hypothetical protein
LAIPDHPMGLPVLPALSLCTCCCHYPGAAAGRIHRSSHPAVSAFPERVIGSACTSSFSRLARHSLTLRPAHSQLPPIRGTLTEGFSHLVTSMTAPVASGWSGRRVGFTPTGKAPPYHGAHPSQTVKISIYLPAAALLIPNRPKRYQAMDFGALAGTSHADVLPFATRSDRLSQATGW